MRRITLWFMSTVTLLVLLFSYHTSTESVSASEQVATPKTASSPSTAAASPSPADIPSATSSTPSASSSSTTAATPKASSTAASTGTLKDGTYTGTSVETKWGPVQVKIVVSGGKITSSDAVVYPTENNKDIEINQVAVPALNDEAVAAQSASIDAVSGASYTSYGYITSLQSALDQAAA